MPGITDPCMEKITAGKPAKNINNEGSIMEMKDTCNQEDQMKEKADCLHRPKETRTLTQYHHDRLVRLELSVQDTLHQLSLISPKKSWKFNTDVIPRSRTHQDYIE